MGHSIAYVFAANGHLVSVTDPDPGALASLNNRVDGIFELLEQDRTGAGTGPRSSSILLKEFKNPVHAIIQAREGARIGVRHRD